MLVPLILDLKLCQKEKKEKKVKISFLHIMMANPTRLLEEIEFQNLVCLSQKNDAFPFIQNCQLGFIGGS